MFAKETYIQRRERLKARVRSGVILLLGNDESPMNYAANVYPFRQDSTFLYFFGLDQPGLAAVLDLDEGTECIFGDDPSLDDIVWTGPRPLLRDRSQTGRRHSDGAEQGTGAGPEQGDSARKDYSHPAAVSARRTSDELRIVDCGLRIRKASFVHPRISSEPWSSRRSVKSAEEIEQIEIAPGHRPPGCRRGHEDGQARRLRVRGGRGDGRDHGLQRRADRPSRPSSPFTARSCTIPYYGNRLQAGDIVINDSGAESPLHYAGDITRTIPVGGRFSPRQREIYSIVLAAQERAIAAATPGVEWRQVHRLAAVALMEGLKELGLVKGDPQEAVAAGAHTLFFPTGLGHMMGLDVHDMEPLGEDYVGYTDTIRRNPEFGWRYLRLAKPVEPGFVITVEPGIYFIPELIDRRQTEGKYNQFIDYGKLEAYRDFGGIRIEDDILITPDGCRVLGPHIPKTIDEVEAMASA